MATFQYECLNARGEVQSGTISAGSASEVVAKLNENGLTALDITEIAEKKKKTSSGKKVKVADLSLFSRQLAAMLAAGIPVTRAISTLSRQQTNPTMGNALEDISQSIEGGASMSVAFAKYPAIFNNLYISMIEAGELGGILEETLMRLANQLQKDKQLKDNIKAATTYPKLVGVFSVVVFIGMMVFLIPIFEGQLPQDAQIPALSEFIFGISESMRTEPLIWIGAVSVLIAAVVMILKSGPVKSFWESQKLTFPIVGPITLRTVMARFARTLATMLEGGVPVVQALGTAGPTAGSVLVANAVIDACRQIEEGKTVSAALDSSGLFPPMMTQMMAIGEESGTLPELLDKVAEFYEDDVATMSKSLGSVIEPLMLIGVGAMVGVLLIAMYVPIISSAASSG